MPPSKPVIRRKDFSLANLSILPVFLFLLFSDLISPSQNHHQSSIANSLILVLWNAEPNLLQEMLLSSHPLLIHSARASSDSIFALPDSFPFPFPLTVHVERQMKRAFSIPLRRNLLSSFTPPSPDSLQLPHSLTVSSRKDSLHYLSLPKKSFTNLPLSLSRYRLSSPHSFPHISISTHNKSWGSLSSISRSILRAIVWVSSPIIISQCLWPAREHEK